MASASLALPALPVVANDWFLQRSSDVSQSYDVSARPVGSSPVILQWGMLTSHELTGSLQPNDIVVIPLEDELSNPLGPPHFVGPDFARSLCRVVHPAQGSNALGYTISLMRVAEQFASDAVKNGCDLQRLPPTNTVFLVHPAPTSMVRISDGGWLQQLRGIWDRPATMTPDPRGTMGVNNAGLSGTSLVQHFGSSPHEIKMVGKAVPTLDGDSQYSATTGDAHKRMLVWMPFKRATVDPATLREYQQGNSFNVTDASTYQLIRIRSSLPALSASGLTATYLTQYQIFRRIDHIAAMQHPETRLWAS
jgi:hypothetical protein